MCAGQLMGVVQGGTRARRPHCLQAWHALPEAYPFTMQDICAGAIKHTRKPFSIHFPPIPFHSNKTATAYYCLLVDDSVVPKLDIGEILENLPIGISIGIRYRVPTP